MITTPVRVPICEQQLNVHIAFDPLTTDDECTCHATLAAFYQLAKFDFKIGFALAKR